MSHDLCGIAYVYWLEGHKLRFDPRRRRPAYKDNTFQAGIDDWCTRASGDNFRRCNLIPWFPRFSDRNLVFTSKFWFFWYHFQVWLHSLPIHLLQKHWIETLWLHRLDIVNPFLSDLSGYVHGFSYWVIYELVWQIPFRRVFEVTCMDLAINQHDVQLEDLIVPLVQTIEEPTLLWRLSCVITGAEHHQEGAGVPDVRDVRVRWWPEWRIASYQWYNRPEWRVASY